MTFRYFNFILLFTICGMTQSSLFSAYAPASSRQRRDTDPRYRGRNVDPRSKRAVDQQTGRPIDPRFSGTDTQTQEVTSRPQRPMLRHPRPAYRGPARPHTRMPVRDFEMEEALAASKLELQSQQQEESSATQYREAISASLAELAYPQSVYDENKEYFEDPSKLVRYCDTVSQNHLFGENELSNGVRIKQLPALYQFYPALHAIYGPKYNTFCGYYAAFFAITFSKLCNENYQDITEELNNRQNFESFLNNLSDGTIDRLRGDVDGDYIRGLINRYHTNKTGSYDIFVSGAVEDLSPDRFISDFRVGLIDHAVLVYPTDLPYGNHWICILVRKNPLGQTEFIIADSADIERVSSELVIEICTKFIE